MECIELYEHNQKMYNNIINLFDDGCHDLCFVQGTGLGKSFIFMKLIHEYFSKSKVLYIVPNLSCKSNIMTYKEFELIKDRVDFKTYQWFNYSDKINDLSNNYDILFIDELHHIGSDINGALLLKAKEEFVSNNKYVIGTTATYIRTDNINTSKYFSECIIGLNIFDAMYANIVDKIEYLSCVNNVWSDDDDRSVKYDINSGKTLLKDIISTHKRSKWLCFFKTIAQLKETLPLIEELFPNHKIVEMHSKSKDTIYNHTDSDKVVVLSVSMLFESLHQKEFNSIINFRDVGSSVIIQQMMGRIVKLKKQGKNNNNPLFIDCSRNSLKTLMNVMNDVYDIVSAKGTSFEKSTTEIFSEIFYVDINSIKYVDLMVDYINSKLIYIGNTAFRGYKEACEYYGINYSKILNCSIELNVSRQKALEYYAITDIFEYQNSIFKDYKVACEYYGIKSKYVMRYVTLYKESKQEALHYLQKLDKFQFRGIELSLNSFCEAYRINFNTICLCYIGKCKKYNIPIQVVLEYVLEEDGYDIEECRNLSCYYDPNLEQFCYDAYEATEHFTDLIHLYTNKVVVVPEKDRTAFGVVYDSIKDMCDAFGIPKATYDSRMKSGKYTIEQALVLP